MYKVAFSIVVCTLYLVSSSIVSVVAGQEIYSVSHCDFDAKRKFYSDAEIDAFTARFALLRPGKVRGVIVHVSGETDGGSFSVGIGPDVWHSPSDIKFEEFAATGTGRKTIAGYEAVFVPLKEAVISRSGHVFVTIYDVSTGIRILSDNVHHLPLCLEIDGEQNYYQYVGSRGGDWRQGKHAFLMELLVEEIESPDVSWFDDVTEEVDLDSLSGIHEIAWTDLDKDGYTDLMASGCLFWNKDGKRFVKDGIISKSLDRAHLTMFCDVNRDGSSDIVVFRGDHSEIVLNDGSGRFEHRAVVLPELSNPISFTFCDVNNDHFVDIAIVDYSVERYKPHGYGVHVLTNTTEAGYSIDQLLLSTVNNPGIVSSINWFDYNGDGESELIISSVDRGMSVLGFRADVRGQTLSVEEILVVNPAAGIVSYADLNTNESPAFLNVIDSHGSARVVSSVSMFGLNNEKLDFVNDGHPLLQDRFNAGVRSADFNNDGMTDVFVANASPCRGSTVLIAKDSANHSFRYHMLLDQQLIGSSSDAALVDYNNDGLIDICFDVDGRLKLLKNNCPEPGSFVAVSSKSEIQCAGAFGGRVELYLDQHTIQRNVPGGAGLLRQGPAYFHFGLGESEKVDSLMFVSPDGETYRIENPVVNRYAGIDEPLDVAINSSGLTNFSVGPIPAADFVDVSFELLESSEVEISIYTLQLVVVDNILQQQLEAGQHTIRWNCSSVHGGQPISSGTYLVQIRIGDRVYVRKALINK